MKRKVLMLMCACMLLGGCSDAKGVGNGSSDIPILAVQETPEPDVNTQTQEPVKTTNGGSGELRQLGAPSGRDIVPVELQNAWEKAAYLADQSYLENGGNVLVSPLSLNVALGMVAEGASGETAQELYRYLGSDEYAKWVDQYMQFAEGLKVDIDEEYEKFSFDYKLANSIWVRQGETIKSTYQDNVKKLFRAEAANADFTGDPEGSAQMINSWCDEHTNGLIPEVVKPYMLDNPNLASVLVNSLYFESPWMDKWEVNQADFTNLAGKTTTQDMLFDYNEDGVYFENEKCTAFAKNYYNGFQFIGILPKDEGDFQISDLDLKSLMESKSTEYVVKAVMPKLDFETTSTCIVDALKAQGVQGIFDPACAEVDKMLEGKSLYVSDILQKCKIELNEEGTKAAAVTVIMETESLSLAQLNEKEVKEVILDRPFAFLIYDSLNDQVVFAGKVTDIQ